MKDLTRGSVSSHVLAMAVPIFAGLVLVLLCGLIDLYFVSGLGEAVARNLFTLMAYKDEYEVARLHSDGAFLKKLQQQFGSQVPASSER